MLENKKIFDFIICTNINTISVNQRKRLDLNLCVTKKQTNNMSILTIILCILIPPLAVFLKHGLGTEFLISLLLTLVGWVPGVIYAFYVNSK